MRAVLIREFGAPSKARVETVADPVPAAGEVLVKIHAAPANYVDTLVVGGTYQFKPKLPFIPGKGPAGVVVAVGTGVTAPKVGDRVVAMAEYGGFAELVAVAANQCYVMPASMSFTEASSMSLAYDTAWFALRERGAYRTGETVLVLGASGAVGFAAVQIAKALGAKVLASISGPDKAKGVLEAGADAVIDLSRPDLRESLRQQVLDANGGKLADIVLDPLGGDPFDAALRALAWNGRLVVIGFAAGRIPTLKTNYVLVKNIAITGLQISDYRKREPEKLAACFAEIFALFAAGKVKAAPVETFRLEDFAGVLDGLAHRRLSRRAIFLP
jgi:NADPH:quinone reductase